MTNLVLSKAQRPVNDGIQAGVIVQVTDTYSYAHKGALT